MKRGEKDSTPLVLLGRFTFLLIGKSVSRHLWITNELTETAMYHVSKKTNPHLGIWVMTQRTTKETMSEERRKRLNSIGFVWRLQAGRSKQQPRVRPSTVEDPKKKKKRLNKGAAQENTDFQQKSWDSNFEQLRDFVRTYKHCNLQCT